MSDFASFGLTIEYRVPSVMDAAHRHNEIELNYIQSGGLVYSVAGTHIAVTTAQVVAFWGALPHQLIHVQPHTHFHCITLPLAWYLRWELPAAFTHALLDGRLLFDQSPAGDPFDTAIFHRWASDFHRDPARYQHIILLELQARLRRLALATPLPINPPSHLPTTKAEDMARFIALHYTEPLTIARIAHAVGLHPNYAMTCFRKTYHVSLLDYLTRHRITHAQRLLVMTDMKIIDIALESGFNAPSRFYEVFRQLCGQSPGQYRARLAGSGQNRPITSDTSPPN